MAIYTMDGKTFIKEFVKNEKPKRILNAQYGIVSTTIRKTGKHKNVMGLHPLFPDQRSLSDFIQSDDTKQFKDDYKEQLMNNKILLAVLVKGVIEDGYDVILICGYNEMKYKYLKYLAKFITKEFRYPVIEYGKDVDKIKFDEDLCLAIAEDIIRKEEKREKKRSLETKEGRAKMLKKMSKKDMIKELKSRNLYYKGMDKDELYETMVLFYVNE